MELLIREMTDEYVRENFQRVKAYLQTEKQLAGFKFFEIVIPSSVTNFKFKHNLGFVPKDVLQTSLRGTGTLTWNYDHFTRDFLDITTTGACTVRAFIGTHQEN